MNKHILRSLILVGAGFVALNGTASAGGLGGSLGGTLGGSIGGSFDNDFNRPSFGGLRDATGNTRSRGYEGLGRTRDGIDSLGSRTRQVGGAAIGKGKALTSAAGEKARDSASEVAPAPAPSSPTPAPAPMISGNARDRALDLDADAPTQARASRQDGVEAQSSPRASANWAPKQEATAAGSTPTT